MSQDDYLFERLTKESERAKINQFLAAIVSNNSGATEPTTTYAYQWWADTTTGLLKIRNAANTAWVTVGTLATAYLGMALAGAIESSGLTIGSGKIAGRSSASTGALEQLSLSQVLDLIGSAAQGDILYRGASAWARLAKGTAYQRIRMNAGATDPEWADAVTFGTPQATTSGTYIDFTGIPSGIKIIILNLVAFSTNGTSPILIQLGDSGGPENAGYVGFVAPNGNLSDGFKLYTTWAATSIVNGMAIFVLENASSYTWSGFGKFGFSNTGALAQFAGYKSLSAEIDRIRITTVGGTDTCDAGESNILLIG